MAAGIAVARRKQQDAGAFSSLECVFLAARCGGRRVGPRGRLGCSWHIGCSGGGMPETTRSLVRTLRQQLGMTQEEFAHQIAVTVSTVNRWENAHAEPSKLAWKAIRDLAHQRGL